MEQSVLDFIKENEGFEALPYKCTAGHLTVGFGHNLDEPMSKECALAILHVDIRRASRDVIKIFPNLYEFGPRRSIALIDMMFNLGASKFKEFEKMIAAINAGDWQTAADEAKDSAWYKQVKKRGEKVVSMLR